MRTFNSAMGVLGLAGLLLLIMVSNQSFWIDECGTASFACSSDWGSFFELLKTDQTSNAQMPLFMILAKGWSSLAGTSEYALRSLNILFGLIAMGCAFEVGKRTKSGLWPVAVMACHPYFWAYMNEFRPYVMQIAAGWMMVLAVLKLAAADRLNGRDAGLFCTAGVLLAGSSLLGVIPLGIGICVAGWIIRHKIKESTAGFRLVTAGSGVLILFLGLYYLVKLLAGGGGAKLWVPGISNIFFSFYELLGFSGLGPGRTELRDAARAGLMGALIKGYLPLIGALAAAYLGVILGFIRMSGSRRIWVVVSAGVFLTGVVALSGLAAIFGWPFWGRHLAPFYPLSVLIISLLLANMSDQRPRLAKIIGCGLLVLLFCSSLNIRFSARFAKDDYRSACQVAEPFIRAGEKVWWGGCGEAASYYGIVDRTQRGFPENMISTAQLSATELSQGQPRMIVLSKAELFDPKGLVRRYLDEHNYQCTHQLAAISIWEPNANANSSK